MLRVGLGRVTPINARTLTPAAFRLDFADLGAGAVSLVESVGNITGSFTRATAAASKLSTGLWKLDVATGVARYTYANLDTTVTTTGGYFAEGARTNSALQARDLTNAAWTKSNLTTAKTSTGIDGVGSSCTRCTASAANGTALQAVTLASAAKAFGVWIKRITGSGEIDITLDNGSTWTNITANINASTFTLVQATQTLANPTVGIRVVTSADAIDVDVAQLEDGVSFISSPVATTVAAVTRNADVLSFATAGFLNANAGTILTSLTPLVDAASSGDQYIVELGDATANNRMSAYRKSGNTIQLDVSVGGVAQVALSTAGAAPTGTTSKYVFAYELNNYAVTIAGATPGADTVATVPTVTTLFVGKPGFAATNQFFGAISSIRYFPRRLSDSVLAQITT